MARMVGRSFQAQCNAALCCNCDHKTALWQFLVEEGIGTGSGAPAGIGRIVMVGSFGSRRAGLAPPALFLSGFIIFFWTQRSGESRPVCDSVSVGVGRVYFVMLRLCCSEVRCVRGGLFVSCFSNVYLYWMDGFLGFSFWFSLNS